MSKGLRQRVPVHDAAADVGERMLDVERRRVGSHPAIVV
jgi:hypothetical protein